MNKIESPHQARIVVLDVRYVLSDVKRDV